MSNMMSNEAPSFAILLLAAGQSSRMGSPKQLLPFQNQTLIEVVIGRLLPLHPAPLLVVLGAYRDKIIPLLDGFPIEMQYNPHWNTGMASSVRCGITCLQEHYPQTGRVMICLVDQPMITKLHYEKLLAASKQYPNKVIAAKYKGQAGVPMIFPRSYYSVLEEVQKDQGARYWVRSHPDSVVTLDLPEAAFDWDTREDITTAP